MPPLLATRLLFYIIVYFIYITVWFILFRSGVICHKFHRQTFFFFSLEKCSIFISYLKSISIYDTAVTLHPSSQLSTSTHLQTPSTNPFYAIHTILCIYHHLSCKMSISREGGEREGIERETDRLMDR